MLLLLGLILGLAIGIGFWVWQQVQLNRYLNKVLQLDQARFSTALLLPRLRHNIKLVKQQRQNFQQQLQTYEALLEFAPVGYLLLDEENQLLWCNEQARKMLYIQRWQPGQVRLLLELVRSYELDHLIEQTRDEGQPQLREWVFHPSCENAQEMLEVKSYLLRATSLPLATRQVGVFLENRQPLVDINSARDRALSDLAHELRTPLTSIRLVVETLQDRLKPPLDRWVERLLQEVDRLIDLVQNWLELTQLETNPTIQLHCQPTEVRSLISSVWESLEPLAQRQHLHLTYSGSENLWINADPARMYQVFLNLLDNSIKYSPDGGAILIETKIIHKQNNLPPALEINIIDSGEGFCTTDLPYVFERFYRGDKARSRPTSTEPQTVTVGSGLGLAIVRQIVNAHGGEIRAMNHPITGGAWLQVEFPEILAKSFS
ncbi:sensor histidine kinase [Iningainema tapete]|uniref:histidine kinase n=1 Tax=Iningainema tapete BLCC-T55 TaxID=2748662 RepID=A0A8J7BYW1_9CYAN|nr:ATP-binding protein [Iningainema tapete]MBD2776432.1 PAS domain-containing protein [Iningainema tapete BLCC-T55]